MKAVLSAGLVIVLTGLALVYSLWEVDLPLLAQRLHDGQYLYTIPFLILLVLFFWLKILRWASLLRPLGNYSSTMVLPATMIGFAGNNLLPSHLGELIRGIVFARNYQLSLSGVFASQFLERTLDSVAILGWFLISLFFVAQVPEPVKTSVFFLAILVGSLFFAILFVVLYPKFALRWWLALSRILPMLSSTKLEVALISVTKVFATVKSSGRMIMLLANSLIQWGLMLAMLLFSLKIYGVSIDVPTLAILLTVISLAVAVPNSPGYFGAMQAAFVFSLTPFGIDEEVAFAASVFYLLAQWIPVTLVGLWFFITSGLAVKSIRQDLGKVGSNKSF